MMIKTMTTMVMTMIMTVMTTSDASLPILPTKTLQISTLQLCVTSSEDPMDYTSSEDPLD
jgi:hypothetical protein